MCPWSAMSHVVALGVVVLVVAHLARRDTRRNCMRGMHLGYGFRETLAIITALCRLQPGAGTLYTDMYVCIKSSVQSRVVRVGVVRARDREAWAKNLPGDAASRAIAGIMKPIAPRISFVSLSLAVVSPFAAPARRPGHLRGCKCFTCNCAAELALHIESIAGAASRRSPPTPRPCQRSPLTIFRRREWREILKRWRGHVIHLITFGAAVTLINSGR